MTDRALLRLQGLVFGLVAAAFANIYITQPVLRVLVAKFQVDEALASLSVAAVILGITLATLPFGKLVVDPYPIRPLVLVGATAVAYLASRLPAARINVVMGSYVSATVIGGLSGRLLGGCIHPPLH